MKKIVISSRVSPKETPREYKVADNSELTEVIKNIFAWELFPSERVEKIISHPLREGGLMDLDLHLECGAKIPITVMIENV